MMWTQNTGALKSFLQKTCALGVLVSVGLSTTTSSFAAFDQVVTWSDMSDIDLKPVFQSQYSSNANLLNPTIPDSAWEVALRDADQKISPEFRIPDEMKAATAFWLNIYTKYTTQHVVLFDSRHPEVVYEVLDFRDLAITARNRIVYELTLQKRVERAKKAYQTAFHSLSSRDSKKKKKPKKQLPLSREEQNILTALKATRHRHSYKELGENLRSQTGQRDNIVKGLLAAEAYFPKMEELFMEIGMPIELTRLSLVESSFDLRAYSKAGAAGIWQFIPGIGKKLLKIDEHHGVDERLSPLKSTVAAARLLKENYQRFKNWPLAVTSYNHGLRGLNKYRKTASDGEFHRIAHLFDPCHKKSPLGWAGRNYYAEFLAVVHAESYRHLFYGQPPVSVLKPVVYRPMEKNQTALQFAIERGLSLHQFKLANPDIMSMGKTLPKGFMVALPAERTDFAGLFEWKNGRKAASVKLTSSKKKNRVQAKLSKAGKNAKKVSSAKINKVRQG